MVTFNPTGELMYQKDLDTLLCKNPNEFPSSFLLFGYSRFLSSLYCEKILSLFGGEADMLKMYFDEYDFESARNFLSQSSLFGDKLILIVKSDKKIPKKELKELLENAHKNGGMIVFELFADISVSKKDEDYHKQFGSFTRFFQPNSMQELLPLAKNEADRYGVKISDNLLSKMAYALNMDLELLSNEVRKLMVFDSEITEEIVRSVVLSAENITPERFYELVLNKKGFANELEFVLERQGSSEVDIVLGFERFVYDILLTKMAVKLHGDAKMAFGYNPPPEIMKMRQHFALSIKDHSLTKIIDTLLQADNELKKSINTDKKLVLVQSLIKIQTFL